MPLPLRCTLRRSARNRKSGARKSKAASRHHILSEGRGGAGERTRPHAIWPIACRAASSSGLVIPGIDKSIPLVIERDTSTIDTLHELLAAGIVTMDTVGQSPDAIIDDAVHKMLGPVLSEFDQDFDMSQVFREDGRWCVFIYDRALDMVCSLMHLIGLIDDGGARVWVGWLLNNHRGISPPERWLDFIYELRNPGSEEYGDDKPETPADQIEAARSKLIADYPWLVTPPDVEPCPMEHALSRIHDTELVSILTDLRANCDCPLGNGEPFICLMPGPDHIIEHAIDRLQDMIAQGNYDQSNCSLFDFGADNVTDLKNKLAEADAWLAPVARLRKWLSIHAS